MSIACTFPSAGTELSSSSSSVVRARLLLSLSPTISPRGSGRLDERLQGSRALVAEVVAVGFLGIAPFRAAVRRGDHLGVELVEELGSAARAWSPCR